MNVTVDRKEFLRALKRLAPFISLCRIRRKRGKADGLFAINYTVRLSVQFGQLRLEACNGEAWAEITVPTLKTPKEGQVCFNHRILLDLVSGIAADVVTITPEGVTVGTVKVRLVPTASADDFPEAPTSSGGSRILSIPAKDLRLALKSVNHAISKDPYRVVLTGASLSVDNGRLHVVATDTHRLAVTEAAAAYSIRDHRLTLPRLAVRLLQVEADDAAVVDFYAVGERVLIRHGTLQIFTNLLSGTYPNWQKVVPEDVGTHFQSSRLGLIDVVRRTMLFARKNANRVRLKMDGNALLVSARSDELGEIEESMEVALTGDGIEVAVNGRYLLDALGRISADTVQIDFTVASRPVVIKGEGDPGTFEVIMPMALA